MKSNFFKLPGAMIGVVIFFLLSPLPAQTTDNIISTKMSDGEISAVPASQFATLSIDNRPVITFRSRLYGYNPKERAYRAELQIKEIIEKGGNLDITWNDLYFIRTIKLGGQVVFSITSSDPDILNNETMNQITQKTIDNLNRAVRERQELRNIPLLIKRIVSTVVATIIFFILVWLVYRGYLFGKKHTQKSIEKHSGKITIGGYRLLDPLQIIRLWQRILFLIFIAASLFLTYLWLVYCLEQFPYTRPWGEGLGNYLMTTINNIVLAILSYIPNIFILILIIFIMRMIGKGLKRFFQAVEEENVKIRWLPSDLVKPTRQIIITLLWLFALVIAYPYIPGSNSLAFKGLSIFAGLLVSLGSTNLVGQAASGIILMYSRALKPGEYVRIGEYEGTVVSLDFLSTKIKTIKREEVNIPNSVLVSTAIKNYTRFSEGKGVILYTSVTIGYSAPWRQVHAMLRMAADRTEGIKKEPKPFINQISLSDFYVEYQLNGYLESPEERIRIMGNLHANIQDVFNEHGVQIMSPHYRMDPYEKVWVPKEKWFEPPAQPPGK